MLPGPVRIPSIADNGKGNGGGTDDGGGRAGMEVLIIKMK